MTSPTCSPPPPDPTRSVLLAGCVRCQTYHRQGFDKEFVDHMPWQAKDHYWRKPTTAEVFQRMMEEDTQQ